MIFRVTHGHVIGVGRGWGKRGGAGGRSPPAKENSWLDVIFKVTRGQQKKAAGWS